MVHFKGRLIVISVTILLILWSVATVVFLRSRPNMPVPDTQGLENRISQLQVAIEHQKKENEDLFKFIRENIAERSNHSSVPRMISKSNEQLIKSDNLKPAHQIAVLVMACNRPAAIKHHVDALLRFRPSADQFPVVVSQDCLSMKNFAETQQTILAYGDKVTYLNQPDQSDFGLKGKIKKFVGYYKIARHYRWALNQTFFQFGYQTVIVTEDDLDISVDFFEYFLGTLPLLRLDPTLWCVSAWNDNGKEGFIEDDPNLLYRSDFFPGLGWMFRRDTWIEIEKDWPLTFWDDWMRKKEQRKDRACIRPEISRTGMSLHGKVGVSRGLYFEKHLKFIKLNNRFIRFSQNDLSYLLKENYDIPFVKKVYNSPSVSLAELQRGTNDQGEPLPKMVRLTYETKANFKSLTKALKLMDDAKAGVARTGYRGVVPFMSGSIRVFLSPPPNWSGYDAEDWK